jgi:ceramide glucosyltransferase
MLLASVLLFIAAAAGLVLVGTETWLVRRFVRRPLRKPTQPLPPISILKPLCGVDEGLDENLRSFAQLDYPLYEVVLGVASAADPAYALAQRIVAERPDRYRLVLQESAAGLNPKVNQLVTLARAARFDVLLISDANVRIVEPGYLPEIAAWLEDPTVGLVTHGASGCGEKSFGALLDNMYFTSHFTSGGIGVKELVNQDMVNGKSMAMRRADVVALGGFEAVANYLAEDFVIGLWVTARLKKRTVFARYTPRSMCIQRTVKAYRTRYARWAVLQRHGVGLGVYCAQVLVYPMLTASVALLLSPSLTALGLWSGVVLAKSLFDVMKCRMLRPEGLTWRAAFAVPIYDALVGWMVFYGLRYNRVDWHGHLIEVGKGTRIIPVVSPNSDSDPGEVVGEDATAP